jgi:hypothetical protein
MKNFRGPTPAGTPLSPLFWARIIGAPAPGLQWSRNDDSPVNAYPGSAILAREVVTYDAGNRPKLKKEAFRLTLSGAIEIEYADDALEPFGGSQGYGPPGGGNTAISEVDSAAIAVAAGEVVPAIGSNPARQRGVTVQNVGTTALLVSKAGGAGVGIIIPPGAAAGDGTGGAVTFDGWTGAVFVANVAGGPGSFRISAY